MMSSSFRGDDLFGSGPHSFVVWRQGRVVLPDSIANNDVFDTGSIIIGERELRIEVRGRLVSSSESGLWSERDAILDHAGFSDPSGTLEDQHGHEWDDVYLIEFEPIGSVERGRVYSMSYRALFGVVETGP